MTVGISPSTATTFDSASQTEKGYNLGAENTQTLSSTSTANHECNGSADVKQNQDASHHVSRLTCWTIGPEKLTWSRVKAWLRPLAPNLSPSKAETRIARMEDFPEGYPRFSWFLSSDDSFMMYRGFNQLHSRVLLQKQDELRAMEKELRNHDHRDNADEDTRRYLHCRALDQKRPAPTRGRSRTQLLSDIEAKLDEYTKCLQNAHFVQNMNKPTDRDHASVAAYFYNKPALVESDREFIYRKEDLVSIRSGREHAWLDALIEAALRWYPCALTKYIFGSEESRAKTNDPEFHYFSRKRIGLFVTLLITTLVSVLLVAPTFALLYLTVKVGTDLADNTCIALLLGCTLVFSIVLSLFTKAKRHEILAAAIAYCAVLVVFVANIGNIGNNAGPINQS